MEIKYKYKNRYIISIMEFNSNDNKGLIWGLLQESNIFQGIDDKQFSKIQGILEETINYIETSKPTSDLMTKNKMAMEELIYKINTEKNKPVKTSKVQMIYTSDDLSKQREDNFNNKLKQQQDNLNTYINPKVPEEPKFKDDGDKPIGDDMDRLIVTFNLQSQEDVPIQETILNQSIKSSVESASTSNIIKLEVNDIFSKLKRKTREKMITEEKNNYVEELINKKEFEILLENQEKIIEFCKSIIEKLN